MCDMGILPGSGPVTMAIERYGGVRSKWGKALAWEKVIKRCHFTISIQDEI